MVMWKTWNTGGETGAAAGFERRITRYRLREPLMGRHLFQANKRKIVTPLPAGFLYRLLLLCRNSRFGR